MLGWIRFDVHGQFYPEDNRSERLPRAWLGLFLLSGQGENQLLVTQEAPPRCISVFWEVSFHECVFFSQFCPMVQDENKVASRWCLKSTTGIDSKGQWSLSVTQGAAILSLSTLNRHYDESVGTHSRPWLKALKPFLRTILTGSANAFIFWWKNLKKKKSCKLQNIHSKTWHIVDKWTWLVSRDCPTQSGHQLISQKIWNNNPAWLASPHQRNGRLQGRHHPIHFAWKGICRDTVKPRMCSSINTKSTRKKAKIEIYIFRFSQKNESSGSKNMKIAEK